MAALFPRWSNLVFRSVLLLVGAAVVGVPVLLMAWARTPWARGQFEPLEQPMWFDHRHHVTGYRIDCRYCHSLVERAATAGVPATEVCVPCHNALWLGSPYFEPVQRSLATGRPIAWRRVHDLPDFVFFNHAIHVGKGVGCESCHGRVDRMELVYQVAPLTMKWCLECHRDPAPHLRPLEEVTTMGWEPDTPGLALGSMLMERYNVREGREITTCTACHR